jgi:tetratricopeptide (TPR) repeat protein
MVVDPHIVFQEWRPILKDYDTGLEASGLLSQNVLDDGFIIATEISYGDDTREDWLEGIRQEFYAAYEDGRPDAAAAIVVCAQMYADDFQSEFDLLYMQGVALVRMLEDGGPPELNNFRMSAFQKALSILPEENRWDHKSICGKIHLAEAWHAGYDGKPDTKYLTAAYDLYGDLIVAMQDGRLPFTLYAKAAELAALRAQTAQALHTFGGEIDPLAHWKQALTLALDPVKRDEDTLGNWDSSMRILDKWVDKLSHNQEAKAAGVAVLQTLQALNLHPENPHYISVQYHIGSLALVTGLKAEGLRTEAQGNDDERQLLLSIDAYRKALTGTEADDNIDWISTAFHLAYALHSLGEARRDLGLLNEAIEYYQATRTRFESSDDHDLNEEGDSLQFAQLLMSMSEAIAQKAELVGDAMLASSALGIAKVAHTGFTLWAHEEGIEAARFNFQGISEIIDKIMR